MDTSRFRAVSRPIQAARPNVPPATATQPTPTVAGMQAASPAGVVNNNVTINISIPKVRLPQVPDLNRFDPRRVRNVSLPVLPYKRLAIASGAVVALAFLAWGGSTLIGKDEVTKLGTASTNISVRATPSFQPIVPANKPDLAQSKAGQTSYDGARDSYSFTDTIQGTSFTVSQQAIPEKFSSAEEAVEQIATGMSTSKEALNTKDGIGYLINLPKQNAQIIVYSAHDLLIMVQSPFKHDSLAWISYLNDLK